MKTFNIHLKSVISPALICSTLLLCSFSLHAEEIRTITENKTDSDSPEFSVRIEKMSEQKAREESNNDVKINIKKAPNYKKTKLKDSKIEDKYKRALHETVEEGTPPENFRGIAEPICLRFNPKQRKRYFVALYNHTGTKQLQTFDCDEFEGLTILDPNAKPPANLPKK